MTDIADPNYLLTALSARVTAIEGAVAALSSDRNLDRRAVLGAFDTFASHSTDLFLTEQISEEHLALIHKAFSDLRSILQYGAPSVGKRSE